MALNLTWAAPEFAWLLLLAIPGGVLLSWSKAKQRATWLRLGGDAAGHVIHGRGDWLPPALAFLLVVTALCQPQWGRIEQAEHDLGRDILVVLDVSSSMLADDLSPNRLHQARTAVTGLLPHLRGERIGLIAFAGTAFLVCPLTHDYATFADALAETGPNSIPVGGSLLSSPLKEALLTFSRSKSQGKVLIVISDGEDQGSTSDRLALQQTVQALKSAGVSIHAVAAGTAAGGLIPLAPGQFHKNANGEIVTSRLHSETLNAISGEATSVSLSQDAQALRTIYTTHSATWAAKASLKQTQRQAERYQIPLAMALLLLLIAPLIRRRGRS
jgi:Ca-activated chloride channel family protein